MTIQPSTTIVCVDCGGVCHLLSYASETGYVVGEIVSYRCVDCLDRWDVELTEGDEMPEEPR